MSRLNTHLSSGEGGGSDDSGEEEDHIAEQLAAGLLIDDGDDDDGMGGIIGGDGAMLMQEEKKMEEHHNVATSNSGGQSKGRSHFVKLPTGFTVGAGGNVVSTEEATRQQKEQHMETTEEGGTAVKSEGKDNGKQKSKRRTPKKKKKAAQDELGDDDLDTAPNDEDATDRPKSASDALSKLKAQEVSIGTSTKVQMKRSESALSLSSLSKKSGDNDTDEPVINLLGGSSKITGSEKVKSKKGKKGKGKNKALGNDEAANLKAARQFNRSVRSCVERSDPDGMREILRDKRNHHFALDAHVLETVMKAYVMAAMFDDALYCLRNCTLPGTLNTAQTEKILSCLPQNLRNSSAYTAADMINALCIATEFDQPTSRTYFMRIVRGISLEFLEEATSARDRICSGMLRCGSTTVFACIPNFSPPPTHFFFSPM